MFDSGKIPLISSKQLATCARPELRRRQRSKGVSVYGTRVRVRACTPSEKGRAIRLSSHLPLIYPPSGVCACMYVCVCTCLFSILFRTFSLSLSLSLFLSTPFSFVAYRGFAKSSFNATSSSISAVYSRD